MRNENLILNKIQLARNSVTVESTEPRAQTFVK